MRFISCKKCKYNFEGECEFYTMGSGNDSDKPCRREEILVNRAATDFIDAFLDSVKDTEMKRLKPMDDLVKRQDAIDELSYCQTYLFDSMDRDPKISLEDVKYAIEQLPSARKKGHWIYPTDVKGFCRCEHCRTLWGKDLYENRFFKYCPRCGSDMRVG